LDNKEKEGEREMNVQNMITQNQYNIDKSRKEFDKLKEEFNELLWMKLNRAVIKRKKEKRKKYLKNTLGVLSMIGLTIILVVGIWFII